MNKLSNSIVLAEQQVAEARTAAHRPRANISEAAM
jgi:hypothetical protein